jgi:hypothetical protein
MVASEAGVGWNMKEISHVLDGSDLHFGGVWVIGVFTFSKAH